MELPPASTEQKAVEKAITKGYNVVVDSVAGSGKTTTILHIAKSLKEKNILLLTYNAKLKVDTRRKCSLLGINNLEVHSYHAFCVKYYDNSCYNDDMLYKIINKDKVPIKSCKYDIIFIDEAQDMVDIYHKLVHKIVKDFNISPQLCLVGDKYQNIYGFKGADERFMTMANTVFKVNKKEWVQLRLSTSYRLTHEMTRFLNNCVLKEKRIKATKSGEFVKYVITNTFHVDGIIKGLIMPLLYEGYKYEDFFLLNTSIKSAKAPIRKVSNILSNKYKIPIYAPASEEEVINEEVVRKKMVISSIHQTKGLERKVVILFGFDEFYYNYACNKDKVQHKCPNDLYVGLTRASERLIVLHSYTSEYLPFLDTENLDEYSDVIEYKELKAKKSTKNNTNEIEVTRLIERLTPQFTADCIKYVDHETVISPKLFVDIPTTTKQGNLHESVAEVNGTAVVAYHELKCTGEMTIAKRLKKVMNENEKKKKNTELMFQNIVKDYLVDDTEITPDVLLAVSNHYCALMSGYVHKVNQITDYSWLAQDKLDRCYKRLNKIVDKDSIYECSVSVDISGITVMGAIDCIDFNKGIVWEFKCVGELNYEHVLQLVVYSYMLHQKFKKLGKGEDIHKMSFKVFNILSCETIEIKYNEAKFKKVLEKLIDNKFNKIKRVDDTTFLKNITK